MIPNKTELFQATHQSLGLNPDIQFEIAPIIKGGSDRFFYRFHTESRPSFIVVLYNEQKKENGLYADIARFLKHLGIQVPLIYEHDADKKIIWMEDIGTTDLYALRQEAWTVRRKLYQQVLDHIFILHHRGLPTAIEDNLETLPGFNAGLYEWEHRYFLDNLVSAYFHNKLDEHDALKLGQELGRLEERLIHTPACLIHRDFQSQNIMLRDNKIYFIDFQGMREGSAYYDLGSLLFDPYVSFKHKEKVDLLEYYYELTQAAPDISHPTWEHFLTSFYEASAQRLMQALGAYGFLGLEKKKVHFLKHIERGLENLVEATKRVDTLPELNKLASKLLKMERNHEVSLEVDTP